MTHLRKSLANEWISLYKSHSALWVHDGKISRPHALLTSGLHSNGFCNSEKVLENPELTNKALRDIAYLLMDAGADLSVVDRVVGPAIGAITIAHDMARQITRCRTDRPCLRAYTEKAPGGGMVFNRTIIEPGERILLVEDVLTTGKSVREARDAVTASDGIPLPYMVVLLNRSGLQEVHGMQIVSLIELQFETWEPENCPLCADGSLAIKPKQADNWALLNAA